MRRLELRDGPNEGAHLLRILPARSALDPRGDIDAPRADGRQGFGDVVGRKTATEDELSTGVRVNEPSADLPIRTDPAAPRERLAGGVEMDTGKTLGGRYDRVGAPRTGGADRDGRHQMVRLQEVEVRRYRSVDLDPVDAHFVEQPTDHVAARSHHHGPRFHLGRDLADHLGSAFHRHVPGGVGDVDHETRGPSFGDLGEDSRVGESAEFYESLHSSTPEADRRREARKAPGFAARARPLPTRIPSTSWAQNRRACSGPVTPLKPRRGRCPPASAKVSAATSGRIWRVSRSRTLTPNMSAATSSVCLSSARACHSSRTSSPREWARSANEASGTSNSPLVSNRAIRRMALAPQRAAASTCFAS